MTQVARPLPPLPDYADPYALTLDPLDDTMSSVTLIQHAGSDKMIVNAARVSLGRDDQLAAFDAADFKLMQYLLRHEHGSPFEHNLITFRLTCPLFIDRQFVRHRAGVSKNEQSHRYTPADEYSFIPKVGEFRAQAANNRQASVPDQQGVIDQMQAYRVWEQADEAVWQAYRTLLKLGVAREQARGVLPQAMYVTSYYTFNVRSLMHLLELRDHAGAQYEAQLFARAMRELARPLFPWAFAALDSLND